MTEFTVFGARPSREGIEELLQRLRAFAQGRGGDAQILDATAVFGKPHLESAYEHAVRARERGASVADSLSVEFLRYAAGERRIDRAIALLGAKRGSPLAVALFGGVRVADVVRSCGLIRDDRVLSPNGKSLRRLGITAREEGTMPRARVNELVLERVALADLVRPAATRA